MARPNEGTGLVAVGDLHLTDSAGKGGLSSYLEEPDDMVATLVVTQVLKYARKNGIKHVILLGDLCDGTRMSYKAQLALNRIVSHEEFEFHIILGNHDLFDADPAIGHSLEMLELWKRKNVHIYLEPTNVVVGPWSLRFLPWPHQSFSPSRLNIAHVDVNGSKTDSGRLNDKEGLSSSKSYAVIGHIHTSQRVRNTFYPGTLYQTNFGESQDKFFAHITWDDGWNVDLVPVKPIYRLHTIVAETKADLKAVPASPQDLIKLIVKGPKIMASDYQHLNIVMVKPVKTEAELALAKVDELNDGSEIEISTDEFVKAWLDNQAKDPKLKARAFALRQRLLQRKAQ